MSMRAGQRLPRDRAPTSPPKNSMGYAEAGHPLRLTEASGARAEAYRSTPPSVSDAFWDDASVPAALQQMHQIHTPRVYPSSGERRRRNTDNRAERRSRLRQHLVDQG